MSIVNLGFFESFSLVLSQNHLSTGQNILGKICKFYKKAVFIFIFVQIDSSCTMKDVTGILTGQGYLASSKSLRHRALGREKERTYRNPRGVGHNENQESRPKQAPTEKR